MDILPVVYAGLAIVVSYLVFVFYVRPQIFLRHYLKQGLPHEDFHLFVGNMPELLKYKKEGKQMYFHNDLRIKHENKSYFWWWGPSCRFTLYEPSQLTDVLRTNSDCYTKGDEIHTVLGPVIGHQGLLLSEGSLWRKQRKLITPLFHRIKMKAMNKTMENVTMKQLQRWKDRTEEDMKINKNSPGIKVELHREMTSLTLDIVSTAIFGSSMCESEDVSNMIFDCFNDIMNLGFAEAIKPINQLPFMKYVPTASKKKIKEGAATLQNLCAKLIEERKQGLSQSVCQGKDLLDLLLDAVDEEDGSHMSSNQVMQECLNFITAGHETTSNLMTFVCYIVATMPEIKERCLEDIRDVMGDDPFNGGFDQVKSLKYIESVLMETLRLYPSAPFVQRMCVADNTIGEGENKINIKAGTTIAINTFALHRMEKYWENPEKFDPERFLQKSPYTRFAFLPFGGGTRSCIGQQFALQEAKIMLAYILQNYDIIPVPGQEGVGYESIPQLNALVTMSFQNDLMVYMKPRTSVFD